MTVISKNPPTVVLNMYKQLLKPQNKLTWQCWTRVRDNGWIPISLILTNAAEGFLLTWVFCPIWHNFSTPRAQSLPDPKHAIVQTVMNLRSPIMLSGAESAARYGSVSITGGKVPDWEWKNPFLSRCFCKLLKTNAEINVTSKTWVHYSGRYNVG